MKHYVSFVVVLSWFAFSCAPSMTLAFFPSAPPSPRPFRNAPPATAPSQRLFSTPSPVTSTTTTAVASDSFSSPDMTRKVHDERQAWIDRSVQYYSKVMREERRRSLGQVPPHTKADNDEFVDLAKKHYFALRKIKDGKPAQAECIYRRILGELLSEDDCDHAQLAVTTLLLALLLQGRQHAEPKQVRAVFLNFFRIVCHSEQECACSAKVLQAFALFEMKQGNPLKSLYIVRRALRLDPTLQPVLQWKLFRDAVRRDEQRVAP